MKLAFFDDFRLGVLKGDQVVDVSAAVQDIPHTGPHNLISGLIERFDQYRGRLEELASSSQGVAVDQVRLRPPLPKPGQIVCMARNYLDSFTGPELPPINGFFKSPRAVIGPGDTIVLPEAQATIFEHEAELGLVIGKRATKVRAEEYKEYLFGYVNFIDVSARGLGAPPMDSFFPVKSQNTFAPLGPYLITADEIADPHDLPVKLWVNGELLQDFSTSGMAYKIPRCLEWATSIVTLEPGDVIATGTNHDGLSPLHDGDAVDMEIAGLGRLSLKVKDDLKRQWPRETRLQRAAREAAQSSPSS